MPRPMKSAFSSIKIGKEAQEPAVLLADDAISEPNGRNIFQKL